MNTLGVPSSVPGEEFNVLKRGLSQRALLLILGSMLVGASVEDIFDRLQEGKKSKELPPPPSEQIIPQKQIDDFAKLREKMIDAHFRPTPTEEIGARLWIGVDDETRDGKKEKEQK